MTNLNVAEMFYTLQGEGQYVGHPAVFLRLAGCNLRCGAVGRDLDDVEPAEDEPSEGASWICDTIPQWKEAEFSFSPEELKEEFQSRGFESSIKNGAHLVLTGGEPTLPHSQEAFVQFAEKYPSAFVEVETNGTIQPTREFDYFADQYNVSLKLSNSGHPVEDRLSATVIDWHIDNFSSQVRDSDSLFKFVVSDEEDVAEIKDLVVRYGIPNEMIAVMPAGQTKSQLEETYPLVAELAKEQCWQFSPRLHVSIWNQATGV